jgi:tRNA U34 5-methylaminomethyl-2-thiouridine-forming methyltransferase MnmC
MAQLPPHHQLVQTEDGSFTFFSENFQEACHSSAGAKNETLLHYVNGCKVSERLLHHSTLTILEVGFGLGLGFLTTMEVLMPLSGKWHFLSLELDRGLIEWFKEENKNHPLLKGLAWREDNILEAVTPNFTLTILAGNARETLPHYAQMNKIKWNAIYQDAFSPKKNPILWTKEWFELLKLHSASDVILSTYSASSSIRKSLYESGWVIHKGEKFGPKRSSTRANLIGKSDPDILLQLERSPVLALSDTNIQDKVLRNL